jgi:hypothetical protein
MISNVFRLGVDIMRLFPINASLGKKIAILTEPFGLGATIRVP